MNLQSALEPGVNIAGPYTVEPSNVSVSIDSSGNALAVWVDNSGTLPVLTSSYYQDGTWSSPIVVATTDTSTNAPLNNSGTAWTCIQEFITNSPLAAIYFNGSTWGSPTEISGMQVLDGGNYTEVAYNNLGQAIIVWLGNDGHIYARVNNNGGDAGWVVDSIQDVSQGGDSDSPSIALSDDQTAIVTWTVEGAPGQIQYATYSFETTDWSTPVALSSSGNEQSDSQVSINASGQAAVTWSEDVSGNSQVFAAIYDGSWGTATNLTNVSGSEPAYTPQVGISLSGEAFAVWQLIASDGFTPTQVAVYSDGTWGSPITLSTTDYNTYYPSVAASTDALAVWNQVYLEDTHSANHAVEVSAYDGTTWSSADALSSPTTGNANPEYAPSGVSLNSSGVAAVAWGYHDGTSNYYVQASVGSISSGLSPPKNAQGKQLHNRLPFQTQYFNRISWAASPTSGVTGYRIFRDGKAIATVSGLDYRDSAIVVGQTYTYGIAAVDSSGNLSSKISVIIAP